MEKTGLVEKRACDRDSRSFRVYVTGKGLDAAARSLSLLKKFNDALVQAFTEKELDTISRFLNFLADIESK